MGSIVPPPSGDHFTSELCIFLSDQRTQFNNLTTQLVRLREVLLEEVVRDSSDSETGVSEEETDAETLEESLSDSGTERDTRDDHDLGEEKRRHIPTIIG